MATRAKVPMPAVKPAHLESAMYGAAAYYWITDPAKASRAFVQVGAGIKLPTGDYRYQDYFYRNDSTKILGPVDQSIQPGDGGTGLTAELNAFYQVHRSGAFIPMAFIL